MLTNVKYIYIKPKVMIRRPLRLVNVRFKLIIKLCSHQYKKLFISQASLSLVGVKVDSDMVLCCYSFESPKVIAPL